MDSQSGTGTVTPQDSGSDLKKVQAELKERVKELNCIYALSSLVETPNLSLHNFFERLIDILLPAWQFPEITCCRIRFYEDKYESSNFKETQWKQAADIKIADKVVGSIEIYYLEEKPTLDEGPFLKQERSLLNAVTERVSRVIERKQLDEKFSSLFTANRDALMTIEPPLWRFTSGNPQAIKLFNAKNEADFLSYEPWRLSPEKQPDGRPSSEKAKEMIEKAMKDGVNIFEWVHKKVTGEEFYCEVLLSRAIVNEKPIIIASVRDISNKKLVEQQLAKHTEELEKMNELMVDRELKMIELKKQLQQSQNTNIK